MKKLILTPKLVAEIKVWIKELRSGEYQQTQSALEDRNGFCCLGVACEKFIPEEKKKKLHHRDIDIHVLKGGYPTAQYHAPKWLKKIDGDFKQRTGARLSSLNDGLCLGDSMLTDRFNFEEIAQALEDVYVYRRLG